MEKCSKCSDGTMQDAKYICDTNDYRVVDLSNNLLLKVSDHNIPSDDDEIGGSSNCKYCSCGNYWS
tara:strand:- start:1528 stop:1725 length:198 start_codon:yes stop_codon:yes gene_type:complete